MYVVGRPTSFKFKLIRKKTKIGICGAMKANQIKFCMVCNIFKLFYIFPCHDETKLDQLGLIRNFKDLFTMKIPLDKLC